MVEKNREEKDIIPFIIYLKADPVLLYERAKKRSIDTTIYDKSTVLNKTKIKVLEYKKNF